MKQGQLLERARGLRLDGHSYQSIATTLGISKSTASLWTRGVSLSESALLRLESGQELARLRSKETRNRQYQDRQEQVRIEELEYLSNTDVHVAQRLLCALIYWCEGTKHDKRLTFTNSDPNLIKYFLGLLRSSFAIDDDRFRVVLHLHEYHDQEKQRQFWSSVTGIPLEHFSKIYLKPHTGKNRHPGYPGCVSVRYYDNRLAKRLMVLAQLAMQGS